MPESEGKCANCGRDIYRSTARVDRGTRRLRHCEDSTLFCFAPDSTNPTAKAKFTDG